ncbi:MAG: flagellar hook-associated protein FlgK [Litorimonas sp.]
MSLLASLSTATAGMTAAGVRAQTASSNISNVETPGYVRRTAVLTQRGANGVTAVGVDRYQDQILIQSRRGAQAQSTHSAVMSQTLSRAIGTFGEPGSQTGIFGRFSQFESDLQTLRGTPESGAAQLVAVGSLNDLIQSISNTSRSLQVERTSADARLVGEIDQANSIASSLFDLNLAIRASSGQDLSSSSLLDQRDQLLDQLNESLPVLVDYEESGAVKVRTTSGLTLVGATLNEIEFSGSGRIGSVDTNTENGGRLSVPSIDGIPIGTGSGVHGLKDGRIAAYLDLRDVALPEQAAGLDAFSFELASALDAAGEPLLLDNGNPVDPLATLGLSERLVLNPLVDPSRGGDPARLRDGLAATVPGQPSDDTNLTRLTEIVTPFADRLGEIISNASSAAYRAERIHAGNTAREITLTEAEQQISAVDLDYELQSLLAIEQAYSANARVIQTVSDMLDTLTRL